MARSGRRTVPVGRSATSPSIAADTTDDAWFEGKSGDEALAALDARMVVLAWKWVRERAGEAPPSSWLDGNERAVLKLAEAIRDSGEYARLPLLADALVESGCTNAEVLEHCRFPGQHVHGCRVVDWLLSRSSS
jgi:hypothetical protein